MLNVHINVRAVVFAPGAGIEEKPRSVKLIDLLSDFANIV